jgi:hypothetical protein
VHAPRLNLQLPFLRYYAHVSGFLLCHYTVRGLTLSLCPVRFVRFHSHPYCTCSTFNDHPTYDSKCISRSPFANESSSKDRHIHPSLLSRVRSSSCDFDCYLRPRANRLLVESIPVVVTRLCDCHLLLKLNSHLRRLAHVQHAEMLWCGGLFCC